MPLMHNLLDISSGLETCPSSVYRGNGYIRLCILIKLKEISSLWATGTGFIVFAVYTYGGVSLRQPPRLPTAAHPCVLNRHHHFAVANLWLATFVWDAPSSCVLLWFFSRCFRGRERSPRRAELKKKKKSRPVSGDAASSTDPDSARLHVEIS